MSEFLVCTGQGCPMRFECLRSRMFWDNAVVGGSEPSVTIRPGCQSHQDHVVDLDTKTGDCSHFWQRPREEPIELDEDEPEVVWCPAPEVR